MGIIPLIYLLLNFKILKNHAPAWLLSISFILYIYIFITSNLSIRNWWVMNLFAMITVFVVALMVNQLAYGKVFRRIGSVLGLLLSSGMFIAYLFVFDWQYDLKPAILPHIAYTILISLFGFFDLAFHSKKDNLMDESAFWYYSGLLIFYSVLIFREIQPLELVQESYAIVQSVIYLLLCISFTIGLYKWKIQSQS
jgi:hypothetical protein